ncbi:MAG: SGNH/GDSL hydrolase family protein [Verrucomicrobiales bacterium]|nr:SGNH/GDSL hydrolase family protein [Verrucomicrobiales bacterium]
MTTSPTSFSPARLAKRLVLWGIGLFLLTEGVLWAFFRAPANPAYPLHFYNHIPGLKEKVSFEVDRRNLRTLGWTDGDKPAGAVRVLCVGGSATLGQLQDAADTWWGQLKLLLEKDFPGTTIQMTAHGAHNGLSLWGAKWAAAHVPELKPDILIVNFGGGEVLVQPFEYKYDPKRIDSLSALKSTRAGWKNSILAVSQLARWKAARNRRSESLLMENTVGREDYFQEQFKKARASYQASPPVRLPFRLSDADPKNEYLDALKTFRDVAAAAGAKLVISGEPCLLSYLLTEELSNLCCMPVPKSSGGREAYRPDPEQIEQEMRRFQEAAKAFADEHKIPFVEVNEQVPRDPEHFVNELILTDKGAHAMAAVLLPEIRKAIKTK